MIEPQVLDEVYISIQRPDLDSRPYSEHEFPDGATLTLLIPRLGGGEPDRLDVPVSRVRIDYGAVRRDTAYLMLGEDGEPYTVRNRRFFALFPDRNVRDNDGNLYPDIREATPDERARGRWTDEE